MRVNKKPDDNSISSNADSGQSADIGIIIDHLSTISTSNARNDSHFTPLTSEGRRQGNHTQRKPTVNSTQHQGKQNQPLETVRILASIIMFSQREYGIAQISWIIVLCQYIY